MPNLLLHGALQDSPSAAASQHDPQPTLKPGVLAGTIPDLANLRNLSLFSAAGNQLTGSLPPGLAQLSQLYFFNVSDNGPGLCGGFTTAGNASSSTRPLTVQLQACPGQAPYTAPPAAGAVRSSGHSAAGAIAGELRRRCPAVRLHA